MEAAMSFREILAADRRFTDLCPEAELGEAFDLDVHLARVDHIFSRVLSKRGGPGKGKPGC